MCAWSGSLPAGVCGLREDHFGPTRKFGEAQSRSLLRGADGAYAVPHGPPPSPSSGGVSFMKQFALGLATAGAMVGVVALSRTEPSAARQGSDPNVIKIEGGDKNPWTSLKINNDPG